VNALLIRLVCGLLSAAMVLGAVAHPPKDLTQGLGMLLPLSMLLGYALKGPPRRSMIPKRKAAPPPPDVSGT
jgi:hypothetical protein